MEGFYSETYPKCEKAGFMLKVPIDSFGMFSDTPKRHPGMHPPGLLEHVCFPIGNISPEMSFQNQFATFAIKHITSLTGTISCETPSGAA